MTTLKDISKHLGLSVTQVSRALNGYSDVNEKTKKRVQDAAAELGYSANLSARSLVTGKSGLVTLIRAGDLTGPADASNLETISGLSKEFYQRGKQFVLHMLPPGVDPLPAYRQAAASGSFDGFVLIDTRQNDERVALLSKYDVPFVVHGRAEVDPSHAFFDIDNMAVIKQHVAHLAKLGHKRFAMLNGPTGFAYSEYRMMGYRAALEEAGLAFDAAAVIHGPMTEPHGMIATARLFEDQAKRPTALICGNVHLAKGAYTALDAMNLSIPEDVSVSAHDDVLHNLRASAFYPSLTVTRSAFSDSWVKLAETLCDMIDGKQDVPHQVVENSEFIARASTAAPKL